MIQESSGLVPWHTLLARALVACLLLVPNSKADYLAESGVVPDEALEGLIESPHSVNDSNTSLIATQEIDNGGWARDPYKISFAAVSGNTLDILVSFGGGCQAHIFQLVWLANLPSSKQDPVQLLLSHDGHGDTCEALLRHHIQVDLSPIKRRWQQVYQQGSGNIVLNLESFAGELNYMF